MKKLFLFSILILVSCSYENPFTARINCDYFPIDDTGNFWLYEGIEGEQKYIEVKQTVQKDGREAIVIEENWQETYWYKGEGYISRYMNVDINFNGEIFLVEKRWQPYIEIPIVEGNSWSDIWMDTLQFHNQPLYRFNSLRGYVEGFVTVKLSSGTFKNVYRIRFESCEEINSTIIGDLLIEETYREWYAPDIGMIKSKHDDENWELSSYGKVEDGN